MVASISKNPQPRSSGQCVNVQRWWWQVKQKKHRRKLGRQYQWSDYSQRMTDVDWAQYPCGKQGGRRKKRKSRRCSGGAAVAVAGRARAQVRFVWRLFSESEAKKTCRGFFISRPASSSQHLLRGSSLYAVDTNNWFIPFKYTSERWATPIFIAKLYDGKVGEISLPFWCFANASVLFASFPAEVTVGWQISFLSHY